MATEMYGMSSRPELLCAEFTGVLSWNEYQVMTYCPSEVRPVPPLLVEEPDELLEELDELDPEPPPQLASLTVMEAALKLFVESVE